MKKKGEIHWKQILEFFLAIAILFLVLFGVYLIFPERFAPAVAKLVNVKRYIG